MKNTSQDRETRKFWVIDHTGIQVTEEECVKSVIRTEHWFCPKYNITSIVGDKLFQDKAAATQVLQRDVMMRLRKAQSDFDKAFSIAQ